MCISVTQLLVPQNSTGVSERGNMMMLHTCMYNEVSQQNTIQYIKFEGYALHGQKLRKSYQYPDSATVKGYILDL